MSYQIRERVPLSDLMCCSSESKSMTVKFFAFFRNPDYAGCKEMQWPDTAGSVYELCHQIADRFGPKFRAELLAPDGERISDKSIILVNGRRVEFLDGIHTVLKDTDTVNIFPVVAGG